MMGVRAVKSLVVLGLSLLGCAVPAPNRGAPAPTIAGHWRSTGAREALELKLIVTGATVAGAAELTDLQGQSYRLTVTGRYTPPTFSLQLVAQDRVLARYDGRVDAGGTMRGVLYDPVLPTDSLMLARLAP
jgi:hypothetical protein